MKSSSEKAINIQAQCSYYYLLEIQDLLKESPSLLSGNDESPYSEFQVIAQKILSLKENSNAKTIKKLYRDFHNCVRKIAEHEISEAGNKYIQDYDKLFIRIYENNNQSDQRLLEQVIGESARINKKALEKKINLRTSNPSKVNLSHPDNPVNAFTSSMLGLKYDPLRKNNIPYVAFNQGELPQERKCIHIGSQTRKKGIVNPTFKRYLLAKTSSKGIPENGVAYVYFNLMKRTQDVQVSPKKGKIDKFVRSSEGRRSRALESLNNEAKYKTAVITLPADGYFFLGSFSMSKGAAKRKNGETSNELLTSLMDTLKESIRNDQNDFYIPHNIKNTLFGEYFENGRFESIFFQAVQGVLGKVDLTEKKYITPEERNAILFHFTKFYLTNEILNVLNPNTYNMSCKDAIDRGAIHSLWYHLNLKHDLGEPMSKEQFLKNLYGPALLVKYRSINDNQNLIWNVLKLRIENDIDFKNNHPWVLKWLEENIPSSLVKQASSFSKMEDSISIPLTESEKMNNAQSQHSTNYLLLRMNSLENVKKEESENKDADLRNIISQERQYIMDTLREFTDELNSLLNNRKKSEFDPRDRRVSSLIKYFEVYENQKYLETIDKKLCQIYNLQEKLLSEETDFEISHVIDALSEINQIASIKYSMPTRERLRLNSICLKISKEIEKMKNTEHSTGESSYGLG